MTFTSPGRKNIPSWPIAVMNFSIPVWPHHFLPAKIKTEKGQNSVVSQPFVRLNVGPSLKAPEFEILFSERPRMKRISGQPYLPSPGQPRHGEAVGVLLKTKRIRRQMILRMDRCKAAIPLRLLRVNGRRDKAIAPGRAHK